VAFFLFDRRHFLRFGGVALGAGLLPWTRALADTRRPLGRPAPLVMLDPGHGGVDPGCIGCTGTYEKTITLETVREFAAQLRASGRYRVAMTRDGDEFVPLAGRVARARTAGADLFLSIHADALPEEQMRGASIFTLSEKASDKEAAALAARENDADLIAGGTVAGVDLSRHAPEVSDILYDLARRETNNESIKLARDLVADLGSRVRLLNHSHRSAGFAVLKAPDIPSALVEIGCLSNRTEEAHLQDPMYQRRIVAGLVQSVDDFFAHSAKI
jgi:N-acetylmuramoyl-L-alanine amidase